LSNLATLNTGNAATSLTVNNVPAGEYYVRVRAIGPDNIPGPPSNEIVVRVGSCAGAPGAPTNLSAQVTGNQVVLLWNAAGGNGASTFVVEAGSGPGLSNIVVFDTGSAATTLSAVAPNGVYYVRIRGRNPCGTGSVSNEIIVNVGQPGTPPPTAAPWPVPPAPEPPGPPPPITTLIPEVTVSAGVAEPPRVVAGPPPRPDAAAGPVLGVADAGSPTPTSRRVRLTSSTPFDNVVVAGDTRSTAARVGALAVAESYYLIRLAAPQTVVEITLTVAQSFTAQFSVSRGTGPFGTYVAQPLASSLGSGALRITLTWNTTADIDLHVLEPSTAHVFYASRTGPTASLDVDDTNGFGPENIFVPTGRAVAGVYQVYIDHFAGSATTSTITITLNAGTAGAITRTFTRTTSSSTRTVNVANVNVLTGQITETTGTRVPDERDDVLAPPKNAPEE
jgi:hypothetical protein